MNAAFAHSLLLNVHSLMTNLPHPALEELSQPLLHQQLTILKNQVDSEEPSPSPQLQFNYAWGLIKSNNTRNQKQGVQLLTIVFRDAPSFRRDCLYYLSLGSYKIGDYAGARKYVETLLDAEPENVQAQQLLLSIEKTVTNEGLIFLGVATGVVAIAGGILGGLLRKKR